MALTWSDIRDNAVRFQEKWRDCKGRERAEAQIFLDDLLERVFGVDARRKAVFECKVHEKNKARFIDMLWPGRILIEMKSKGESLDKAHEQARHYMLAIPDDDDLPQVIMVCDFFRFRLYKLLENQTVEFELCDLPENVHHLEVLTDFAGQTGLVSDRALDMKAASRMARLHDGLRKRRYAEQDLGAFLVRILFCLFADHAGIFAKGTFSGYVRAGKEDGSDLGARIGELFEVLDTPAERRMENLRGELRQFPYVDGRLFEGPIRLASFDAELKGMLLDCCEFDWSTVSPAIFGAMFQSVMDPAKRVALGEQYTPQSTILKVLKPLMLDGLYEEFRACGDSRARLEAFHRKLASIRVLDPACGCGNFLAVAYAHLRRLEKEVLRTLYPRDAALPAGFDLHREVLVDVDQFYGFDVEDFPCRIAAASMWLTDHKMNADAAKEFGLPFSRIPLDKKPRIARRDALETDWQSFVRSGEISYIVGNPPFIGAKKSNYPRESMRRLFAGVPSAGLLDAAAGWFLCAAKYMQETKIRAAFVATNSIIQGEQPAVLWEPLFREHGIEIIFGHRPFKWTSEAKGKAAVQCVVIGFQAFPFNGRRRIFDREGVQHEVETITPYLDDIPETVALKRRHKPLCDVPAIGIGCKPIDDSRYLFKKKDMEDFVKAEPLSAKLFKQWWGADEFLDKTPRWCLRVAGCPPDELSRMPKVLERIKQVQQYRLNSTDPGTQKLAGFPERFQVENMPSVRFLVIPEVSGEKRSYIPMGFMEPDPDVLCSNLLKLMPGASLYHFGILTSSVHMAWMRAVGGTLEGRYRYSGQIVYNNFPWPDADGRSRSRIERFAQAVLDVRERYRDVTYKDLYNDLAMPADLRKAHAALDRQVKKLYGLQAGASDRECVATLFSLYRKLEEHASAEKRRKARRKNP